MTQVSTSPPDRAEPVALADPDTPVPSSTPSAAPAGPGRPGRSALVIGLVLAALAGLALWGRVAHLDVSFWQDEAKPAWAYVREGPGTILFGTYDIDNHVLFGLLAWATTSVFGESEIAFRLWSLLPALASAAWLVVWAWRRFDRWAGMTIAVVTALAPMHLDLAPQARGYGLTYLALAGMIVFGDAWLRDERRRDLIGFAASGFVGATSFPIFAIPLALAGLVLLAVSRRRVAVAVVLGVAGAVTLGFLANALPQLLDSAGDFQSHRKLLPLPWSENVLWPLHVLGPVFGWAADVVPNTRGAHWYHSPWEKGMAALLVYPLLAAGVAGLVARRTWRLAALLLVPVAGTYFFVCAIDMALWNRYTSYFLYPAAVVLGVGVSWVIAQVARRPTLRGPALAVVAVLLFPVLRAPLGGTGAAVATAILVVAVLVATPAWTRLPVAAVGAVAAGALVLAAVPLANGYARTVVRLDDPPREDWKRITAWLDDRPYESYTAAAVHGGLVYYLGHPELAIKRANSTKRVGTYADRSDFVNGTRVYRELCASTEGAIFVETGETAWILDKNCLERRAEHLHVDMLLYGGVDVWWVPPTSSPSTRSGPPD